MKSSPDTPSVPGATLQTQELTAVERQRRQAVAGRRLQRQAAVGAHRLGIGLLQGGERQRLHSAQRLHAAKRQRPLLLLLEGCSRRAWLLHAWPAQPKPTRVGLLRRRNAAVAERRDYCRWCRGPQRQAPQKVP